MKKEKEKEFYDVIKNWDFSKFEIETELLTNWDLYEILKKIANEDSKILDLGTGGGEKLLKSFPKAKEILGTDFSEAMIETANKNLLESGRDNISFRIMDNLNMDVPDNYYDIVVARNTITNPKQIYKCLKKNGYLLLRGVDKDDCWALKVLFGKGQGYAGLKPISLVDYEAVLNAGFKDVELIPLHVIEYYKTKDDLYALLLKVPILDNLSELKQNEEYERIPIEKDIFELYVAENTTPKGIKLIRRYYGITARK